MVSWTLQIAEHRQALNEHPRSAELSLLLAAAYDVADRLQLAEKRIQGIKVEQSGPGLQYVTFLIHEEAQNALRIS